jgi:hypothetical protein
MFLNHILNLLVTVIFVLSSCESDSFKNKFHDSVNHHSEELDAIENQIFLRLENVDLKLNRKKNLKKKVSTYLNEFSKHFKNYEKLMEDQKFYVKLHNYMARLFYTDLILYNKINYKSKNTIVKKIFKAKECETKLKVADNNNWKCFFQSKKESDDAEFCACSYEYDCYDNEQLPLGFSKKNLTENTSKELVSLCELNIKGMSNQQWACKIGSIEIDDGSRSDNDEVYCDCFLKRKCEIQKIIQEIM